jgi:hypothetical protein
VSVNNPCCFLFCTQKQAQQQANKHKIPRAFLTDDMLLKKLNTFTEAMQGKGLEFSVSLNALFSLPITDCVFSKSELRVKIRVPIKQSENSYTSYKVIAVPFQFGRQQCLVEGYTPSVVSLRGEVIPITTELESNCNLRKEVLCKVPHHLEFYSGFQKCAKSLFTGIQSQIQKVGQIAIYDMFVKAVLIFHCFCRPVSSNVSIPQLCD